MSDQKNENKDIILQVDNIKITLKNEGDNVYQYEFVKSLSNVNSEADILPLCIEQQSHIPCEYEIEDDLVKLSYTVDNSYMKFDQLAKKETYEKLHVLKNINKIIDNSELGYSYILHPNNIVYDDNFIPSIIYVGFRNVLYPIMQDEKDLLYQYKCLVSSLFDNKYDFDSLYNGGLDILKKNKFLQKVFNCTTVAELKNLLDESYEKEYKSFISTNKVVSSRKYGLFRIAAIFGIIISVISVGLLGNVYLNTLPFDKKMNNASYQFVSNDYGKVILTLRDNNVESLPTTQKYMLAYSYIKAEPMNNESKASALSVISTKSDKSYLEFWIYIGRENYTKANELAKELSDLKLQYHASYRAIEIIKNDKKMNGSTKEEKMKLYEEELKKVEEKLFGTTEN